jgi:hypothetical protein
MATSAIIIVEGMDSACVYKHWDGYPESTMPWLEKFNEAFFDERGEDPAYKFAQLLRSSIRDAAEFALSIDKFTGWGVLPLYDETRNGEYSNFTYTLHADGTVTVITDNKDEVTARKTEATCAAQYEPVF